MDIIVGVIVLAIVLVVGIVSEHLVHRRRAKESEIMQTKINALHTKADRIERKIDGVNNHLCKEIRTTFTQIGIQLRDIEKEANLAKHGAHSAETNAYDALQVAQEIKNMWMPATRKRDNKGRFISEKES